MLFMLKYLGGAIEKKYQRWIYVGLKMSWTDLKGKCWKKDTFSEYIEELKSIIKHEYSIRKIDMIKFYSGWNIKLENM